MSLTPDQLTTLKADIAADGTLSGIPNTPDGAFQIADIYNQDTAGFYVWKTSLSNYEVRKNIVWTEYIASSSQDEKMAFELMLSNGQIDPSDINVRSGIATIFGSPQQATTRDQILAISQRIANRIEELFATGTGSQVDPATMVFEGSLTYQDVYKARNL
jgi:hypothetical protein